MRSNFAWKIEVLMPRHPEPEVMRTLILDAADALFLADGVRATGMDAVTERAGIAKTTIYRYFETKDDLVLAYLDRRDGVHFDWLDVADVPAPQRLDAVIERIQHAVIAPGFPGCPFLNVAAEFGDARSAIRRAVASHKRRAHRFFRDLCHAAGIADPERAATGLMLVTDGAYEAGRVSGRSGPAAGYRAATDSVLGRTSP